MINHKQNIYILQYFSNRTRAKQDGLWSTVTKLFSRLLKKYLFRLNLGIWNVCFGEMKQNFDNRLEKSQSKLALGSET